jgi:lambda family phage portal protein
MPTNQPIIERAIKSLAPAWAMHRARARFETTRLEYSTRRYEAAATSRRTSGWHSGAHSANAEIGPALHRLRSRSRDLVRNNMWASSAVNTIESNAIGTGIVPVPMIDDRKLAERAMNLWNLWAGTTNCDAEGRHNFAGLQALAMRSIAEGGEMLVRRRSRRPIDGLPVPLQLQLLEPDFIDSGKDSAHGSGTKQKLIVQGVEFGGIGAPKNYWLHSNHPGSNQSNGATTSKPIAARDIAHVFRTDRIGQARGVPWGAPCLLRLRDFDDFEDAQLLRQKIAALFVAFTHDFDATEPSEWGKDEDGIAIDKLKPGTIEHLPPGRDVRFADPPGVEGYADYSRVSLRAIAAGYGVTYESLTGDLGQVNFSSGRMGWLEFQRSLAQWQHLMFIPQFCSRIWRWFNEAAVLSGLLPELIPVRWTPPRREMIDPRREILAMKDSVNAGFTSHSEAVRTLGYDPIAVTTELAKDLERFEEQGLALDLLVQKTDSAPPPVPDEPTKGSKPESDKKGEAPAKASPNPSGR